MRELNCVIMPNSQGWSLVVGGRPRAWFPSKDSALRAAIDEAQRGRVAGFYGMVRVQHKPNAEQESARAFYPK